MKLDDDSDPSRHDEREAPELERFVRAARARRPSPVVAARMAERLAPARAAAAMASSSRAAGAGSTKLVLLSLVAIGGALAVWQVRTSEPSRPPETPSSAPVVTEIAIAPPDEPKTSEVPTLAVEALPSAAAPARSGVASSIASTEKPSRAREDEYLLIQRAQEELGADPNRALATLHEHARSFPDGELGQERETIAVEALARLHRMSEAKARASALLIRFPRTPYVARLERALGEPLPSVPR
jgi:hypothetical protein